MLPARQTSMTGSASNLKSLTPLSSSINLSVKMRRNSIALRHDEDEEGGSSKSCFGKFCSSFSKRCNKIRSKLVRPCLRRTYPRGEDEEPSNAWKFRDAILCPPHGKLARLLTAISAIFIGYGFLVVTVKEEAFPGGYCGEKPQQFNSSMTISTMATTTLSFTNIPTDNFTNLLNRTMIPNVKRIKVLESCVGSIWGLYVVFISALIAAAFLEIIGLPPLLGMLLVGVFLRNIPGLNVIDVIAKPYFTTLRNLALTIILTRAGLCMNPKTLMRLSAAVFRLAFIPCLIETCGSAMAAVLILGFPWEWGFMLGFVLGAVSPVIVVISMLKLEARGYGVKTGVPTLMIAAASIDDVLAITGFSFAVGIAFKSNEQESMALTLARGPLEALAGVIYGLTVGYILWYLPTNKHPQLAYMRTFFLLGCGSIILLGSTLAHIPGAGALGVLTLALMAGIGWNKIDGWTEENNPVIVVVDSLWFFAQPILFGLIGAELNFSVLEPKDVGLGLLVIFIGLLFRSVAAFMTVFGVGLTWMEMFFVPIAWIPKATVQAAIGPVALDQAFNDGDVVSINRGSQILTIAVLAIIVTAPLGAILIPLVGPRMLEREDMDIVLDLQDDHETSYLNKTENGDNPHGGTKPNETDDNDTRVRFQVTKKTPTHRPHV